MEKKEKLDVENGAKVDMAEIPIFHAMDIASVSEMFSTDPVKGLTIEEAAKRLERDGPNKLTEAKRRTIWQKLWDQLANVLVIILLVVAAISVVKGATSTGEDAATSYVEVGLIIGVVVLNTWIGIRQEGSAEKAADALKSMLSSGATVIRDGSKMEVPAQDLVLGDLVVLTLGDKIPADLRMVKVSNMASQEAALTGESLPIDKRTDTVTVENPEHVPLGDRKNLAFSATTVVQGEGVGIVVRCGDDTEIGQINHLVQAQKTKKTNVLVQIDIVSRWIAAFVILAALATFLAAFFQAKQDPLEAVTTGLVAAVAMIPEGLAAIVTLTYSWAVSNMAKRNAIVRVLPAVETLGSVTVICSDKTGTLTQNLMSMVAFVVSNGRFRVDVNASDRKAENFVRDDLYLSDEGKDLNFSGPEENGSNHIAQTSDIKHGESPSLDHLKNMLSCGILCSKAELPEDGGREGCLGNPTEISIMRAAFFAGIDHYALRSELNEICTVPFSSEYKFMATVHSFPKGHPSSSTENVVYVKGALDRLLPVAVNQAVNGNPEHVEPIARKYWSEQGEQLASQGFRVLCLCRATIPVGSVVQDQKLERDFVDGKQPWLTVVGLAVIQDPPRPECIDSIKVAHTASVRVAMITGDHKSTALAIGKELGIVDKDHPAAITGPEMDELSDSELRAVVKRYNVFARSSPENKIRIVKALQAEGEVCSMTGDGVNDAPALKAADMGVAMGQEGTDVARESAEMILADDNFTSIVEAVREGRVVWDNLRKILLFNTPVNNAQGLTVLFGIVAGVPYAPLTPIQVLYCNLICAVTLGFVLAVEPAELGIMQQPPRRPGKRLIGRYLLFRIAYATVLLVVFTVSAVVWVRSWKIDLNIPAFSSSDCADFAGYTNDTVCCLINEKCDPFKAGDCQNRTLIFEDPHILTPENGICPNSVGRALVRAQASNTLTLSAISIMLSARFAYNTAFHKRLLTGNKYAWWAAGITLSLQVCITYIPGLNDIVFAMGPMNGPQWGICILFVVATFVFMEAEKMFARFLKKRHFDTDGDKDIVPQLPAAEPDVPFVSTISQRSAALHDTRLKK